ncbi:MAG: GspH/FimT family pseudopilin [Gallionellaceae bacterium]|nr:GspH/FimT family pseudopilin [Gallionellaceae bacterium]
MRSCRGVTLIELMVTITIVAILATVAVPSFVDFIRQNRVSATANEFVALVALARSEAIRRGNTVTVCKSADKVTCTTSGNWGQAVIVFVDGNTRGVIDGADTIVRVVSPPASGISVSASDTNVSNWLTYLSSGVSVGNGNSRNGGSFAVCGAPYARTITIDATGRVSSVKTSC